MSRFITDLNVEVSYDISKDKAVFKLLTKFSYVSDYLRSQGYILAIDVPVGFATDFASVPHIPILWDIAGGIGNKAATIHDYLYTERLFDRHTCDKVFKEALKIEGVGPIRRNLMYYTVRMFGSSYYWNK